MRPKRSVEMPPTNPAGAPRPRHADGDVEAGSPGNRYGRVAPVNGFDGQEINQGVSATQQHGASFFVSSPAIDAIPCIASRLSRSSFRISP